jgi:hypothetical protein
MAGLKREAPTPPPIPQLEPDFPFTFEPFDYEFFGLLSDPEPKTP